MDEVVQQGFGGAGGAVVEGLADGVAELGELGGGGGGDVVVVVLVGEVVLAVAKLGEAGVEVADAPAAGVLGQVAGLERAQVAVDGGLGLGDLGGDGL